MPFDPHGRWASTTQLERQQDDANDRNDFDRDPDTAAKQRRATEVRSRYERLTAPPTKSFGSSFDMGQGLKDYVAFERCAEEFGFRRAVVALREVSKKAGERYASYRTAWRLP